MNKTRIALSLGGNQGNVAREFHEAAKVLRKMGMREIKLSRFYRTSPVGCAPGTPDFINGAMTGIWGESLHELFETCKSIEVKAGRPEGHPRYASRPLDIDIIFFGNLVYHDKILTIPHREASERLFVLIPLADVASDWIFPGKDITVAQMLNARKNSPEYEKITDTADSRPQKSSFSQFFTGLS